MFEKLIETLVALIAAIKDNTAALKGAAPAAETTSTPEKTKGGKGGTKSETKAETKSETSAASVDDIRTSAKALLEATEGDKDGKVADFFGSRVRPHFGLSAESKLTDCAADRRAEMVKMLTEKLAEFKGGSKRSAADDI